MYCKCASISAKSSIAIIFFFCRNKEITIGIGTGSFEILLPCLILFNLTFEDSFNIVVVVVFILDKFGFVKIGM